MDGCPGAVGGPEASSAGLRSGEGEMLIGVSEIDYAPLVGSSMNADASCCLGFFYCGDSQPESVGSCQTNGSSKVLQLSLYF